MLDDGTYDIIVVDADAASGDDAAGSGDAGPSLRLDVTILAGVHKGEMVSVRAAGLDVDEIEALGMPGTLTVRAGAPSIILDR